MVEETDLEKCNFWNFRSPVTLTLDWVTWHTVTHHSLTYIYTPNFIEIGKTFCGWTDGGVALTFQTRSNLIRSTRRNRPKNVMKKHLATSSVIWSHSDLCCQLVMQFSAVLLEYHKWLATETMEFCQNQHSQQKSATRALCLHATLLKVV